MFVSKSINNSNKLNNTMKNSNKKSCSLNARRLQIESLESRELLSVSPLTTTLLGNTPAYETAALPATASNPQTVLSAAEVDVPASFYDVQASQPLSGYNAGDWAVAESIFGNITDNPTQNNLITWTDGRITSLNLYNRGLKGTLDVSGLANLQTLSCYYNELTSLNVSGLANLQYLGCDNNDLTSLNISGLANLQYLNCYKNQLTSLNVSGLANLQYLYCDNNQLTSLNVSGLANLQSLSCGYNQLTSLNVSGLANLQYLYCSGNQLTSLNVSGLANLQSLICSWNELTSLNVSGLANLQSLSCFDNQLTSLNVSGLANLQELDCDYNQLTSLNVSGLANLQELYCSENELTSLNVSGLANLQSLICSGNELTSLDVSGLAKLQSLFCGYNGMQTLYLAKNPSEFNYCDYHDGNPGIEVIVGVPETENDSSYTFKVFTDNSDGTVIAGVNELTFEATFNTSAEQIQILKNSFVAALSYWQISGENYTNEYRVDAMFDGNTIVGKYRPLNTQYGATHISCVLAFRGKNNTIYYAELDVTNSATNAASAAASANTPVVMNYAFGGSSMCEANGKLEQHNNQLTYSIHTTPSYTSIEEIARDFAYASAPAKDSYINFKGERYYVDEVLSGGLDAVCLTRYAMLSSTNGEDVPNQNSPIDSLLVFRGSDKIESADAYDTITSTIADIISDPQFKISEIAKTLLKNTALSTIPDVMTDFDMKGIGHSHYESGRKTLLKWANEKSNKGADISVTGHSLGGALAQWFASEWTSKGRMLKNIELFQPAGINLSIANSESRTFNENYVTGDIVLNIAIGDIVSLAGKVISGNKVEVRMWNVHSNDNGKFPTTVVGRHTAHLTNDSAVQVATISASAFNQDSFDYNQYLGYVAVYGMPIDVVLAFNTSRVNVSSFRTSVGIFKEVVDLPGNAVKDAATKLWGLGTAVVKYASSIGYNLGVGVDEVDTAYYTVSNLETLCNKVIDDKNWLVAQSGPAYNDLTNLLKESIAKAKIIESNIGRMLQCGISRINAFCYLSGNEAFLRVTAPYLCINEQPAPSAAAANAPVLNSVTANAAATPIADLQTPNGWKVTNTVWNETAHIVSGSITPFGNSTPLAFTLNLNENYKLVFSNAKAVYSLSTLYNNQLIDLSAAIDSYFTDNTDNVYQWKYSNNNNVESGKITTVAPGKFVLDNSLVGQQVYCVMTNPSLEGFTMTTNTVTITSNPNIPLAVPGLNSVTQDGSFAINVTWNSIPNASQYVIEISTDSNFPSTGTREISDISGTSYRITGLAANTLYYVRIKSVGDTGYLDSPYSSSLSATTAATPLSVSVSGTNTSDADSNSLYDNLTVNTQINATVAGTYRLTGFLYAAGNELIATVTVNHTLVAGSNTVNFTFNGQDISLAGYDGLYTFAMTADDTENGGWLTFDNLYQTSAFTATTFEGLPASFTDTYSDNAIDEDSDGEFDRLNISVGINVKKAGTYFIVGYLSDEDGNFAGYSSQTFDLQTGIQTLSLNFNALYLNEKGQWLLSRLVLIDGETGITISSNNNVYATQQYNIDEFRNVNAPSNLRLVQAAKTTLIIGWNKIDDAVFYELQRKTTNGDFVTIYTGLNASYTDYGLTANTDYEYQIRALSVNGSSVFTTPIIAATLSTSIQNDVPAIIKTTQTNNQTTLEWADLGNNYTYYVFRNGALVAQSQTTAGYNDNNIPTTARYLIYAYNENTGEWTKSIPVVLSSAPVHAEIISHEVTAQGGIKLNWNIPQSQSQQFIIFRNGIPVSGVVSNQTWTDTTPSTTSDDSNQYTLYVNYTDSQGFSYWTWSSPYVVQKPTTQSQSANILDAFWADYNLNYDFDLV
jgi:Leucine-rich repeat (LRR) protein